MLAHVDGKRALPHEQIGTPPELYFAQTALYTQNLESVQTEQALICRICEEIMKREQRNKPLSTSGGK